MAEEVIITVDPAYDARFDEGYKRTTSGILIMAEVAYEVREAYGYPMYCAWLEERYGLKQRMANNLLAVRRMVKHFGMIDTDRWVSFAPSAIYILAASSTPEDAVEEALTLAEQGETVTHAIARGIVARMTHMREALQGASEEVVGFVTERSVDDPELVEDLKRLEASERKPGSNGTFSEIVSSGGFHYGEDGEQWCDVTSAPAKERYEALKNVARQHISQSKDSTFGELLEAVKGLLEYREQAGEMGFRLEKADEYLRAMRKALEGM